MTNYFRGAYESRDMAFDGVSQGISKQGMMNYIDSLQLNLLKGVGDKLSETEGIETAIKKGWQGASRDKFLKSFSKGISMVKSDLAAEFSDLMYRLAELTKNYYEQDKKMMDMVD